MQFLSRTIAPLIAAQAMAQTFIRGMADLLLPQMMQEQALQQKNREFVESVKKDPNVFLDLVNRAKEKIQEKLVTVKQKLVDIKKSIAQITLKINRATRKISILMNRMKNLQNELKEIQNKIKELEKQPGQEKNVEILKAREQEILAKLRELNLQIQMEQNRIKQLEGQKEQLVVEKNTLELTQDKYQTRLNELDSQKLSFEQALGIAPRRTQPLQKILQQQIKENARLRQQEPTQTSNGNMAFSATYNPKTNNFELVESARVLPTDGIVGRTPQYAQDDSIITQYHVRNRFIASRLNRAQDNGFTTTPSRENNNEHGGKDNPSR